MTEILIVEGNTPNMPQAAPGFADVLTALAPDLNCTILHPYADAALDFADADGIVFTGSGVAWGTDAPEAAPQRAAMEQALGSGKPVWGSCSGLQLAGQVLGCTISPSPHGQEVPVARDIRLTDDGQNHPMMAGRTSGFSAPCIHRDEVHALPTGAILLAGNAHSAVQAFALQSQGVDFWGTQYHPELHPRDIAAYIRTIELFGDHDALLTDLEHAETDMKAAERLGFAPDDLNSATRTIELANWLTHVKQRAET